MTVRSLLLGIDSSPRRLGWGLVDLVTGEPVACGCHHLWVEKPPRLREEIDWAEHPWRTKDALVAVARGAGELNGTEVQAVYVERPALPAVSGTNSAFKAGLAVGVTIAEVRRRWPWAVVQTLEPKEWRVLAGLPGNAPKAEVWESAINRVPTGEFANQIAMGEQDAADALLIAIAGQKRNAESWQRGVDRGAA